jgi:hypothetical protein
MNGYINYLLMPVMLSDDIGAVVNLFLTIMGTIVFVISVVTFLYLRRTRTVGKALSSLGIRIGLLIVFILLLIFFVSQG